MSGKTNLWIVVLISTLAGTALGLLVNGQSAEAESEGRAMHITALAGAVQDKIQTVYIVDALEQTLMIYEYGLGKGALEFVGARTFEYDKKMQEYNTRITKGKVLTVAQVKKLVKK